jgi:hypothetical protein
MLTIKLSGSLEVITSGTKGLAKDWMWMTQGKKIQEVQRCKQTQTGVALAF